MSEDKKMIKELIRSVKKEIRGYFPRLQKVKIHVQQKNGRTISKVEVRCMEKTVYSQSMSENIYDALEMAKESAISQIRSLRRRSRYSFGHRRVCQV